jgi:hypothetical protein
MVFKVRDLMIQVVPEEYDPVAMAAPGYAVPLFTYPPPSPWCLIAKYTYPPPTWGGIAYTYPPPTWGGIAPPLVLGTENRLAALAILKQQLQQQLAEVEVYEKAISESSGPQTVDQVDALIQKLEGAIGELKKRKDDLGQKPHQP